METEQSRPQIAGLLFGLILLFIFYPLFLVLELGPRDREFYPGPGYDGPWRIMAMFDGAAVLLAAILFWFAAWRLCSRGERRSVTIARRCIWIAIPGIIILEYVAIGSIGGFRSANPLLPDYVRFCLHALTVGLVIDAYLYRSARVARTYPSPDELESVFE